eukprot:jgi/Mesvir1/24953/Mv16926-RA.1
MSPSCVIIFLSQGDKIALVGNNGCGKSTLLRVLAGIENPDSGNIQRRRGLSVGYLAQDPRLPEDALVLEAVLAADTPTMAAVREFEAASIAAGTDGAKGNERLQRAMQAMDAMGAWTLQASAHKVLDRLGVGRELLLQRVATLSGGQKKRVALASSILSEPDLLILDEPTNHMDMETIEWMEEMLRDPALTVLQVTHDRFFLERVCNEIVELDGGGAYPHAGNYSAFQRDREARYAQQAAELAAVKNKLRVEADWMSRMPKARGTKSKSRIQQFHLLTKRASQGRVATDLELTVGSTRLGGKILSLKDVTVTVGNKTILDGFSYDFKKGERVGIIGKNGAGKTTMLNVLAGLKPVDAGEREVGETVSIGFFEQMTPEVPEDKRVIDYVKEVGGDAIALGGSATGGFQGGSAGNEETISASMLLERFGFKPARQYERVSKLSGGEKRRVHLATVLMKKPNFLLLDEPSNDLDLYTLETLEMFLHSFAGVVVMVSHDRAFIDSIAQSLFILEGDGVVSSFEGSFSEYQLAKKEMEEAERKAQQAAADKAAAAAASKAAPAAASKPATKAAPEAPKKKLSYMLKREYEGLEEEISGLVEESKRLQALVDDGTAHYETLLQNSAALADVLAQIDAKTERWLELAEMMES